MSFCYAKIGILAIFILFVHSQDDFSEFVEYVNKSIDMSEHYDLPVDNRKLLHVTDFTVKDYGTYDFIIVGGGSAGGVLAARLSEEHRFKVLLLEAGGNQTRFSDIPGLNNYLRNSDMNWGYKTTPQDFGCLGMVNRQCLCSRGKVLGGSGTLNAIAYTRGIPTDFDTWVNMGNTGWSFEDVLPYFKKTERVDFPNYDSFYRSTEGPIHVNFTAPDSLVSKYFMDANIEKGLIPGDYNAKDILSVSKIQFTINGNRRDNSAHGYLDPIVNRPNLDISLHSFVTRILIINRRAIGVQFVKNGHIYEAFCSKEVILSAGTINTPQLLMLSGIGPANHLRSHRIGVLNDLPAVGRFLQDHPMFVNFYIRVNVTEPDITFVDQLKRYLAVESPLTRGARMEQIGFINTRNNSKHFRDIELCTTAPPSSVPNAKESYNFRKEFAEAYDEYNTLTDLFVALVVLHPKSRGSVTLKSNKPLDFPNINPNFFSDPYDKDVETMYQGIKYTLSLLETEAFKKVNAKHVGIQPQCEHLRKINDRQYWYCAIRRMTSTMYHPTGTARMGPFPGSSVVDTNCKVHNMDGLRVVDASVMPESVSSHPNAVIFMIAEKIAQYIKECY